MSQNTEVIELSDDSEDMTDRVVVDLRRKLGNLRKEQRVMKEQNVRLHRELAETRRRLAELESSQAARETLESQAEITRVLNHDLEQMTSLAQGHYLKYMAAERARTAQKTVIESLWKALECPICFEPLYSPVIFRCGHLVCQGCAPASPICGHCRTPTGQQFTKVYALGEITSTLKNQVPPDDLSPQKPRR